MPISPSPEGVLELTDNELFLQLGREVIGSGAVPQSLETLIQKGRETYSSMATLIGNQICDGKDPRFDFADLRDATLISALTSYIIEGGTFVFSHAAAMYIAAIIARAGLQKYCSVYGPGQAPPK